MGRHGAEVLPDDGSVLTHCNAGALATGGYGTALGVVRAAVESGKRISVYADETRPFLQGARLTALGADARRDRHHHHYGRHRRDRCFGAGGWMSSSWAPTALRRTATWRTRFGTYTVAVLAREHGVPFYVAAPTSTVDLATPDGSAIPIEERNEREVTHVGSVRVAPEGVGVWNPAFDVTPHVLIAGIITEQGICRPPYAEGLRAACEGAAAAAGAGAVA